MKDIMFANARIFDGCSIRDDCRYVSVHNNRIDYIGAEVPGGAFRRTIDCAGKTLMPGLIDAHVHVYAFSANLSVNDHSSFVARTLHAQEVMSTALMRGFTSLRDAGGADRDLADALANNMFTGPRLFYSGKALSQTGGHGDFRPGAAQTCGCGYTGAISLIADGEVEVRRAAREQLRLGASQIKIMASGGTASPTDALAMEQYSIPEIEAAVEEARRWGTYVMAHAYTPGAISRCVKVGVRSIEHGNFIDAASASLVAEHGAFVVPTLSTYDAIAKDGASLGWEPNGLAKIEEVRAAGVTSLLYCREAGVKMGFGTDLLGSMHRHQCDEFRIRAQALSNLEILRSATSVNAELLQRSDDLGCIKIGALADLIVVDGNPVEDIGIFDADGSKIVLILKDGKFIKDMAERSSVN